MKTVEFFKKKTVLSYEVFPPKRTSPVNTIYDTLSELKELSPDFISVTYGAGGGENNNQTFEIASAIKSYGIESVSHLPCIGLTKEDVSAKLKELKRAGIENILALRGDVPSEGCIQGDFRYASDLIAFIKSQGDFNILAACYPEGHIEAESKLEDIRNLKRKVDAGANHLVTQLFFDNEFFYSFIERCQLADINVPIEAGIMPVINKKQIERMASLCGVTVPKKFVTMMERYENNPIAMRDAGIAYAIDQIVDLTAQGVDGIHLYTMNNPYIARKIHEAIHSLI
ncbi:MAG: methylenetetrahydrofolate reductase [NAD(P)H] [Clostridiaceae bacterium]|nr:methylenetetrahydrofolate reductase [NAD(P)H] [Clostridiaceae bacterium]